MDSPDDTPSLCAILFPDGSVSLYVDEAYAIERGVDPSKLVRVEIPRQLYTTGTIQQVREYVATYLASNPRGSVPSPDMDRKVNP
jgi:hypothetical protein